MIRFFSWFLIPCITILIPGRESWLTSNFSVAASELPARYFLILWAFITGGFLHRLIRRTIGQPALSPYKGKEQSLTDLAAVLLILSVLIPYQPEKSRFFSALHVIFAFWASALFYLILLLLDFKLYFYRRTEFSRLTAMLIFAGFVSVSLFLLADFIISSALEIFFTIFSCVWLTAFHRKVCSLSDPFYDTLDCKDGSSSFE